MSVRLNDWYVCVSHEKECVIASPVVNRHRDKAVPAEMISQSGDWAGKAEARILTADFLNAPFVYGKREQYKPVVREWKVEGKALSFSFPPHSITQIRAGVRK